MHCFCNTTFTVVCRKKYFHNHQLFWMEAQSTRLQGEMREACLCKEKVHNLRAPASSATKCNSHSLTPLSHSLSVAWQSLPHHASCDSLPVPALHLHSPGWSHGRFSSRYWAHSPSVIMRVCMCVFVCVHSSACLAQTSVSRPAVNVALHSFSDDLFREAKALQSRKAHQTVRGGKGQ